MYLNLAIKRYVIILFMLCGITSYAQEDINEEENEEPTDQNEAKIENPRQKLFVFSFGYHNPIPTGDNFIGKAFSGKSGFDVRLKAFIYKQFFVEYNTTSSRFNVEDQTLVGNYTETRIFSDNFLIGYEFLPIDNFRLGVSASFIGKSRISNKGFLNAEENRQFDSGNLRTYGFYVSYDVTENVSFYIDYFYRITKTKIDVPRALEDFFRNGTYHTIGVGISLSLGKTDVVSRFTD